MKKILIIDDELSIVNFITDVSKVLGFDAKFLTSGKKAFSTAKEWKPDVITLDIMIPSPNGLEVLALLKADPETASIPVFVISAVTQNPEIREKLSHAQAVFTKPMDTKDFITHLRNLDSTPKPAA